MRATPPGTQTLVRGLAILEHVAQSTDGVTVQQVADLIAVHRTMALRALAALSEYDLVRKGADGRFRIASGVIALGRNYLPTLREASRPVLDRLSSELGSSTCLLVADGDEAAAVIVIEPADASWHLTFKAGSRHPLDRGSAGYALQSLRPPTPDEPEQVAEARRLGYARSHGEVEPGAWGVTVPLDTSVAGIDTCVHMITFRREVADRAAPLVMEAARRIEDALRSG